jgi:hypothetical protein
MSKQSGHEWPGQGGGSGECVQVHFLVHYEQTVSQVTSGQAREENVTSVYGYTGTLWANRQGTLGTLLWGAGGARCGRGSARCRPAQSRAWQILLAKSYDAIQLKKQWLQMRVYDVAGKGSGHTQL